MIDCLPGARTLRIATLIAVTAATASPRLAAQAFPDRVVEFIPGPSAGFGSGFYPANVLGAPHGNANAQTPTFTEDHILSLGTGGVITLEFTGHQIVDGPGVDFTIFENPVEPIGLPEQSYVEAAVVAVSVDGETWHTFPFDIVSTAPGQLNKKANYIGFAGVMPSFSSPLNGISPFDPVVSGGDQFDLADVGISGVRFIRITDTGHPNYNPVYDADGDLVSDYGNLLDPVPGESSFSDTAGFDLDGIAAIHTEPYAPPSCISLWQLYE